MTDLPEIFYFGCESKSHIGHFLYGPHFRSVKASDLLIHGWGGPRVIPPGGIPWGYAIDGKLAPKTTNKEGLAVLHHKDGWTAISFWDYSADHRGGSNSTFLFRQILDFESALILAKENFPEVFERFDFEIVEWGQDETI